MQRKLKLQVQISIDGFIAGPNGEMDWMIWDWSDDLKAYIQVLTDSVDTIVLGRKLAEGFIPHWADIAAEKDNPENEAGIFFTQSPKIVFSNTLEKSQWENILLAKGDLKEEINKLKNQNGEDIIVYGGTEFVSNLIKESLINEFHLFVNPGAIGKSMPIFQNLEETQNLKLLHSKSFDCGIAVLAYELQ